MRYLRQFCAVTMLVCALAFTAYAGDIPCPGVAASSPQVEGEIPNDITATVLLLILALV